MYSIKKLTYLTVFSLKASDTVTSVLPCKCRSAATTIETRISGTVFCKIIFYHGLRNRMNMTRKLC